MSDTSEWRRLDRRLLQLHRFLLLHRHELGRRDNVTTANRWSHDFSARPSNRTGSICSNLRNLLCESTIQLARDAASARVLLQLPVQTLETAIDERWQVRVTMLSSAGINDIS